MTWRSPLFRQLMYDKKNNQEKARVCVAHPVRLFVRDPDRTTQPSGSPGRLEA